MDSATDMAFARNDWLSTTPGGGVLIDSIELSEGTCLSACRIDGVVYVDTVHSYESDFGGVRSREQHLVQGDCETCGELMLRDPNSRSWRSHHCQGCLRALKRESNLKAAREYRIRNGLVKVTDCMNCAHCGEAFKPQRSTARFCSTRCRVAAHRAQRD